MDYAKLAHVLRAHAESLDPEQRLDQPPHRDTAELIRVLARVLEGRTIDRAFGAPGDWGYNTPIGAALYEAYRG